MESLQDLRNKMHLKPTLLPVGYLRTRNLNEKDISRYKPQDTNEKCLADKPSALPDMEWEDPVKFWITEEHQVLFGSNIKSSHQKSKHTMGRRNFPRCKADTLNDIELTSNQKAIFDSLKAVNNAMKAVLGEINLDDVQK
ncbi:hypothetical protein C5167_037452 [Papaver somniferum]|uniref:Uncharacterized protein n=1 Tax=Papaver somniferum TaxID=3469 RepID=A0A4Y7IA49_PAPSO|nr:hypothetical protein C5167_037452 [Papaver somniferum]